MTVICVNGHPKLTNLGLVSDISVAQPIFSSPGYAPDESFGTIQHDLYSLGIVLYQISTGCNPADFPVIPANMDEIPDHQDLMKLNKVVIKACENQLKDRYPSAEEMHGHLLQLQS